MNWLTKKLKNSLMRFRSRASAAQLHHAGIIRAGTLFAAHGRKLRSISVDTAGMEVTSSGQKGI